MKNITITRENEEWLNIINGIDVLLEVACVQLLTSGIIKEHANKVAICLQFKNELCQNVFSTKVEEDVL